MRDRTAFCGHCQQMIGITANLTTGRVTKARVPEKCPHPTLCVRKYVDGVFDRPHSTTPKTTSL
jgi:hypothetical protein